MGWDGIVIIECDDNLVEIYVNYVEEVLILLIDFLVMFSYMGIVICVCLVFGVDVSDEFKLIFIMIGKVDVII